jgi:putative transposase
MTKIRCSGYRFPPEIIHQAIWLYLRFTISLRDVEDLLADRGIAISYETVRRWVNHFGPIIAAELRKRRLKPRAVWHLDEVYLKIDGRMVYLWRAVDSEGEVLDVLVQSKRNKHAALNLMRKLLKKYAVVPERMVTDDLRSYGAGTLDLGIGHLHDRARWKNNRTENSHQPTRRAGAQDATLQERGLSPEVPFAHGSDETLCCMTSQVPPDPRGTPSIQPTTALTQTRFFLSAARYAGSVQKSVSSRPIAAARWRLCLLAQTSSEHRSGPLPSPATQGRRARRTRPRAKYFQNCRQRSIGRWRRPKRRAAYARSGCFRRARGRIVRFSRRSAQHRLARNPLCRQLQGSMSTHWPADRRILPALRRSSSLNRGDLVASGDETAARRVAALGQFAPSR